PPAVRRSFLSSTSYFPRYGVNCECRAFSLQSLNRRRQERNLQRFQHPDFAIDMAGTAQRRINMLKAEMFIQANGLFEEGGCFEVTTFKTLSVGMFKGDQRQFLRQPLSTHGGQEIHFLQLADIRLAAAQWRNAASAHDLSVLLDNPVGMAWLAIKLEQFVQVRVGNRIAFISSQAILGGNGADNGGNSRVVLLSDPTHRRRDGGNHAHSITHYKN